MIDSAIPFSQFPCTVAVVCEGVLAAGAVNVTVGAVESLIRERTAEPIFPAASVCEAVMVFEPSPEEKVTACEKVPEVHDVVDEEETPVPEKVTVKPVSQVPCSVAPVPNEEPDVGDV